MVFRKEKSSSKSVVCDEHFGTQYRQDDGQFMDSAYTDDSCVSLVTEDDDDEGSIKGIFAPTDVIESNSYCLGEIYFNHSSSKMHDEKSERMDNMSVCTDVDALDNLINVDRINNIKKTLSRIYDEQLSEIMTMLHERSVKCQEKLDCSLNSSGKSGQILPAHKMSPKSKEKLRQKCKTSHAAQHPSTAGKVDTSSLCRTSCVEETENISSLTVLARTLNKNYGVGTCCVP